MVPALQPLNKDPSKQDIGFCGTSILHGVLAPDPVIISGALRQQLSSFSLEWGRV